MTTASLLLALLAAAYGSSSDDASKPVLLDFHAAWCGPCQQMKPAVEQLSRKGYPIKSVDIDQSPELAARYRVQSVPTFIVVDSSGRELDRTQGFQPAATLVRFYRAAAAKAQPPANSNAHSGNREGKRDGDADEGDGERDSDSDEPPRRIVRAQNLADAAQDEPDRDRDHDRDRDEVPFTNPKPWETVVRIKVMNNHSIGFGSGTVIYSTPEESLILTCAHIFKLEGRIRQPQPGQFPRRIVVDLFDGKLTRTEPRQVHYLESVDGKALDYDFIRDVGLIRIRPGRRLPACRVVPAHWQPKARMKMLTVGCSEGHDATAWHTAIVRPRMQGFLAGNSGYEAMECVYAPKQGRSGGGIFTEDGYIAGVCNFAEPIGDHGLYATPRSLYSVLDRNSLMALYAAVPRSSAPLLADGRSGSRPPRSGGVSVARSQSPDPEELRNDRPRRASSDQGDVMIPPPTLLGIADPVAPDPAGSGAARATSASSRRSAWHPTPLDDARTDVGLTGRARTEPTDLNLDPAADHDRFGPPPMRRDQEGDAEAEEPSSSTATGATTEAVVIPPAKSRWRPVKMPMPEQSEAGSER
jgi:thiol-disulfide isomerase/thioredoxin